MKKLKQHRTAAALIAATTLAAPAAAQTMKAPDITKTPTLYVVPYAHLDTQWRWEFPQSISEYLLKTMRVNFDYMDRYPHYVFNWTGANRYRLMKEYFPADYARMKTYIAAGRWIPSGSSVEEGDVNLPGAEGLFRQILYGNEYYRQEFGHFSNDYMLPDCFGFPASLPTILAHAHVKGFSTQKLNAQWQPAVKMGGPDSIEQTPAGIPFNVGLWQGPDGKSVLAALNPGTYNGNVYTDLSKSAPTPTGVAPKVTQEESSELSAAQLRELGRIAAREQDWVKRINRDGQATGIFADYHYVGTGDIGGATRESSVKLLEAIVTKSETVLPTPPASGDLRDAAAEASAARPVRVGEGPVHVVISAADQMFQDITPAMQGKLPTYKGDLELINHSAGSLTSQAYHKRWVMKNELLADSAEKTSVLAAWLGARTYPQQRLNAAWMLALAGHFHDTGAGTATPHAYELAWNDDAIAGNQFGAVFADATESIAASLNTATQNDALPLVIFNPLNIDREDVVEAKLTGPLANASSIRVTDPAGHAVPAQVSAGKVIFTAKVPSVGFAVFHVSAAPAATTSELSITQSSLENHRYRVELNPAGDISRILDKKLNKDLLSAPIRLAISTDRPRVYPAWNMDFDQEQAAPRAFVGGPATTRIAENGPARVTLEVSRQTEGSHFVERVSLAAGEAGERVDFHDSIDWQTLAANLKVVFPLSATNPDATYNWEVGTVQRETAQPRQFEVASHRWIDLTDASGTFGTTILTGYKNGSDKRTDNTIRLTLLRSPGIQPPTDANPPRYGDQQNQDWGHHEISFGLAGHAAGWRDAQTDWQAERLHEPMIAFWTTPHPGPLGTTLSLLRVSNSRIRVLALKKAEGNDDVILRMVELDGKPAANVRVTFPGPIASAREVDGQEQDLGPAQLTSGALTTSFTPYQPRTFALKLGAPLQHTTAPTSTPLTLPYNLTAASADDQPVQNGGFDGTGRAYPAEMLPAELQLGTVKFRLAPAAGPNTLTARGQAIPLPAATGPQRVYILAAAIHGDQPATFTVGSRKLPVTIENWTGYVAQWDNREWRQKPGIDWAISATHAAWPPQDLAAREAWPTPLRYPEDYIGLTPGYVKPATLAWFASHLHTAAGLNQPYQYTYLFAYPIDLQPGEHTLTLPDNPNIRIFAISTTTAAPTLTPAQPLWEDLGRTTPAAQLVDPVATAARTKQY